MGPAGGLASSNSTWRGERGERDERLAKVEVAVLVVLLVLTVLGNAVVLLALYARRRCGGRKKLSRMFYFILHLSVADMVTAFFSVLPQLVWKVTYRFHGGNLLCKAVKFGQPLGVYLSSYVLTATALDRYRAICHPLTYCAWSSQRSKAMVIAAWVLSFICSAPQAFIFSYREINPSEFDCWADFHAEWGVRSYVTWYAASVFLIPLAVLLFTYTRISCEIWRCASTSRHCSCHSRRMLNPDRQDSLQRRDPARPASSGSFLATRAACPSNRAHPLISRAKINTVKQSVLVICFYITSSAPFILAQLWAAWRPASESEKDSFKESGTLYTIVTLLFSLNSCVNPWIYLAFNSDLVRSLRQLLACACVGGAPRPVLASAPQSSCSSPSRRDPSPLPSSLLARTARSGAGRRRARRRHVQALGPLGTPSPPPSPSPASPAGGAPPESLDGGEPGAPRSGSRQLQAVLAEKDLERPQAFGLFAMRSGDEVLVKAECGSGGVSTLAILAVPVPQPQRPHTSYLL